MENIFAVYQCTQYPIDLKNGSSLVRLTAITNNILNPFMS